MEFASFRSAHIVMALHATVIIHSLLRAVSPGQSTLNYNSMLYVNLEIMGSLLMFFG
jgi:hypothetical protein